MTASDQHPDMLKIAKKWLNRSRRIQNRHYEAAAELQRWHYATGAPLVVLSVIEGSALLATITELTDVSTIGAIITGVVALAVAVLAAMQAFMGFETRSRLHHIAGVKYGVIKRQLETKLSLDPSGGQVAAYLETLGQEWDSLVEESPPIPLAVWRKAEKKERKRHLKNSTNSANAEA